jgi:hypothetical protein
MFQSRVTWAHLPLAKLNIDMESRWQSRVAHGCWEAKREPEDVAKVKINPSWGIFYSRDLLGHSN